ncbi:MAG: histidine kinase dimerization/phospho-acceptor domain-containing protein [Dysosmobacter sp.]
MSDASHELKTPLTVILSNAELLEGQVLRKSLPGGAATSIPRRSRCALWWSRC